MSRLAPRDRTADPLATPPAVDAPILGSGNFLADRGHADPEETRVKFLMCNEIAVIIEQRDMTQAQAAEALGLAQSDVSRIVNGNVKSYSVWRLMRAMNALGRDVSIAFSPAENARGRTSVSFADRPGDEAPAV